MYIVPRPQRDKLEEHKDERVTATMSVSVTGCSGDSIPCLSRKLAALTNIIFRPA